MTNPRTREDRRHTFWQCYLLALAIAGGLAALAVVGLRGRAVLTTSLIAALPVALPALLFLSSVQRTRAGLLRLLLALRWLLIPAGIALVAIAIARGMGTGFTPWRMGMLGVGGALVAGGLLAGLSVIQHRLWDAISASSSRPAGLEHPWIWSTAVALLGGLMVLWLARWVWAGFNPPVNWLLGIVASVGLQAVLLAFVGTIPSLRARLDTFLRAEDRTLLVLILSAAVAFTILMTYPIVFGADSLSYWQNARVLAGLESFQVGLPYRTPGYPLLMLLTGVAAGSTFWWLLALQAAMAIGMPVLIYRTVHLVHPPAAFPSALVVILTAVPYLFMKSALTETPYMFFLLWCVYLAVRFVQTGRMWALTLSVTGIWFLAMLRPSATYLIGIFALLYLLFRPSLLWRILAGLAIYAVATMGVSFAMRAIYAQDRLPGMTGKMLFFNVYLSSSQAGGFSADLGPATASMIAVTRETLMADPGLVSEYAREFAVSGGANAEHFLGRYRDDPAGLSRALFADPTRVYYWLLWDVLDRAVSPQQADRVFLDVSLEKLKAEPRVGIAFLLRNLRAFLWGPPIYYVDRVAPAERIASSPYNLGALTEYSVGDGPLPAELKVEIRSDPGRNYDPRYAFRDLWAAAFRILRPLVFLVMLLGTPVLLGRPTRFFILTCWLIIAYSALIVCVFNEPLDRYVYQSFSVEVMAAVTGLWMAGGRLLSGRQAVK